MATKGESKSKRTDSDAILRELIKKEMRIHRLSFNYMLSPSKAATLVITQKPTGDPLMMKSGETILDSNISFQLFSRDWGFNCHFHSNYR